MEQKPLSILNKMLLLDPTNEALLKIKPQLEKSAKQPTSEKFRFKQINQGRFDRHETKR